MKNHMRSKRSGGFTLVEVLATVAILVILLAVSAVSVVKYIDVLKITEMDNAARDIYMAAENRAVLLSGAQRLDDLVKNKVTTEAAPAQALAAVSGNGKDVDSLYYVSKTELVDPKDDASELLLDGSIDPALMDGDFYIVYDMAHGSVREVFYAKDSGAIGTIIETVYNKSFSDFYADWSGKDRDKRLEWKTGKDGKTYDKTLVGRYSGAADGAAPWTDDAGTDIQEKPYINVAITNNDELTVKVTVKWGKAIGPAVSRAILEGNLSVTLDAANNIALANLVPTDLAKDIRLNKLIKDGGRVVGEAMPEPTYAEDIYTYECTWVLDSLTGGGEEGKYPLHFQDLGSDIAPGADFTVKVTIEPVKTGGEVLLKDSFIAAKAETTNNSLFEYWTDETDESSGKVAHIAYLRHLQNLSTDFSGVNKGATSEDNATITSAVQTAHIEGKINGEVEYPFVPIVNDKLTSYDGNGIKLRPQYKIRNLTVSGADNDNVGLFGQNYATCTIKNVIMENCTVTGTGKNIGGIVGLNDGILVNCQYIGENAAVSGGDTGSNVGGLVGWNRSSIALDGENGNLSTASVSGDTNVGGIVGLNTTYDPSDNPEAEPVAEPGVATVQNFTRSEDSGTVTGKNKVGGIVGGNGDACKYTNGATSVEGDDGTHAVVINCHNEGAVGIDKDKKNIEGSYVGGVVGYNNGKLGFDPADSVLGKYYCSNSGPVSGKDRVGGVVGSVESTGEVQYCYNDKTGTVTGTGDNVGGVAGYITNTNQRKADADGTIEKDAAGNNIILAQSKMQYCYNIAAVTGTGGNVGGVVGRSSGDVSNCYNDGLVTGGGKNVGGVVGEQLDSGKLTNCYNTGNVSCTGTTSIKAGGVVGNQADSKEDKYGTVENCYYLKNETFNENLSGIGGVEDSDDTAGQVKALTKPQFAKQTEGVSFVGWDFTALPVWTFDCSKTYDDDTSEDAKRHAESIDDSGDSSTMHKTWRPILRYLAEEVGPPTETAAPAGLVYYEQDASGTYYIYGLDATGTGIDTLTEKKFTNSSEISKDGYALIVAPDNISDNGTIEVKYDNVTYTATVTQNGTNYTWGWKDGETQQTATGEAKTVTATVSGSDTTYYLIPLPDALKSSASTYTKLTIGDGAPFYFNPDFAKTVKASNPSTTTYTIRTGRQLNNLSVSEQKYYSQGYTFNQELNLTLTNDGNNKYDQKPIGSSQEGFKFAGTYDGGTYTNAEGKKVNHTITGLSIGDSENSDDYQGLFGFVMSGSTVKNVDVSGSVSGGNTVGGIAGSNFGKVENCNYSGTVTGNLSVGGIVGLNGNGGEVTKCKITTTVTNSGRAVSGGNQVGGIVGNNNGTVTGCQNDATVNQAVYGSEYVGGIAGNNGNKVTGCHNNAKGNQAVYGIRYVGGIVGANGKNSEVNPNTVGTVTGCNNAAAVTATGTSDGMACAGGIVGQNNDANTEVTNCTNSGPVEASVTETSKTTYCNRVGGIVGYNNGGTVKQSSNTGAVTGGEHIGGIVGRNDGGEVSSCYNGYELGADGKTYVAADGTGAVKGDKRVGGIVGSNTSGKSGQEEVNNCHNNASVTATTSSDAWVGGIVGDNNEKNTNPNTAVANCTNSGTVQASNNGNYAGGIVGYNNGGTVTSCKNGYDADRTTARGGNVTGRRYVGGIVGCNTGGAANRNDVYQCVNSTTATVTATDINSDGAQVGGIVGKNGTHKVDVNGDTINGMNTTVANCENNGTVQAYNAEKKTYCDYAGGVVGYNDSGTVESCVNNNGAVDGKNSVGGVVGYNTSGTVQACFNTGNVSGNQNVGGIAGYSTAGTVSGCYNGYTNATTTKSGVTVTGNQYVGGIVGYNTGGTSNHNEVYNCHNNAAVTVENASTSSTDGASVGGVVGYNKGTDTTVANCSNRGAVKALRGTAYSTHVGGVVGYVYEGTVQFSYNTGAVTGSKYVGGVAGLLRGSATDTYNTGAVTGKGSMSSTTNDGTYIGGVVGQRGGGKLSNSYNIGAVTGNSSFGGVVGHNGGSNGDYVNNCYYLESSTTAKGINGKDYPNSAEPLAAADFGKTAIFTDREWTFATVTKNEQNEVTVTGDGTWVMCIDIRSGYDDTAKTNAGFLAGFPTYRPGLKNNLEENLTPGEPEEEDWVDWTGGEDGWIVDTKTLLEYAEAVKNWKGDKRLRGRVKNDFDIDYSLVKDPSNGRPTNGSWLPLTEFDGYLEGNGYTIGKLNIERNNYVNKDNVGLFADVKAGGEIANLNVEGTIETGQNNVGGIVGLNAGTVRNCSYNGSVKSAGNNIGGIVGENAEGGKVIECYKTDEVSYLTPGSGNNTGGIVGKNDRGGTVRNCYNTGSVTGKADNTGGIVGDNSGGTVQNCHNTGTVTGGSGKSTYGGIAGANSGTVTNCYYLENKVNNDNGGISGSDDQINKVESKTATEFSNGTVRNLLNDAQTGNPWGMVSNKNYPVLIGVGEGKGATTGYAQSGDTIVAALPPDRLRIPNPDDGDRVPEL